MLSGEEKMKSFRRTKMVVASAVGAVLCSVALIGGQTQRSSKETATPAVSQPAAKLQPLNVKPGLWESRRTITRTGALPIPAEVLNQLTPEQRARMEERMKANSAGHTTTQKDCITREDLERKRLLEMIADAKECTITVLNSSSTNLKGKMVCDTEGMHVTGNLELVASDTEHVNGSYHSTATGNGRTMNVESTWTAKWLGPSCGNVR
jgi:hypothetical protein